MRLPFAFMKSAAPVFNPASLAATIYLTDYAGAPWIGTASAGTSAAQDFAAGGAPSVGANFGTHPSADFNGTTHDLYGTGDALGTYFTGAAWGLEIISEADALTAPTGAGTEYTDVALFGDSTNGEFYVTQTTAGIRVGLYDGVGYQNTTPIPHSAGVKSCTQIYYDNVNVYCRVNGKNSAGVAGWESVAVGNLRPAALTANVAILGATYAGGGKFDGRIARVMAFAFTPTIANFNDLYANAQSSYSVP